MIVALLACAAPDDDTALPSAWAYDPGDVEGVADADVIQEEVQDLLDNILLFNATDPITAWYQVRQYGDTLCPNEVVSDSADNGLVTYFDRLCVVDERYWFKGPMTTYVFEDLELAHFEVFDILPYLNEDFEGWTGQALKGQTDVFDSGSDLDYNCSCTAFVAEKTEAGERSWVTYTDGPTHFTAPEADLDSWMNQGIQSHMYTKLVLNDDGRFHAELVGSVTGYEPTYGDIEMGVSLDGQGHTCATDTPVSMAVRHTLTGQRTDLDLEIQEDCSLCGTLDDTEICFDTSALFDWEGSPW